jgi:hypothetical protein
MVTWSQSVLMPLSEAVIFWWLDFYGGGDG